MAAEHEDHGNTVAAWTTVITIIVGFTIGGVGVMIASIPTVVVGAVICVLGVIAGKALSMAGFGKQPAAADEPSDAPVDAEAAQAG